jgi:hypothetical protein
VGLPERLYLNLDGADGVLGVGAGLVDRWDHRAGAGLGVLTGVDGERLEAVTHSLDVSRRVGRPGNLAARRRSAPATAPVPATLRRATLGRELVLPGGTLATPRRPERRRGRRGGVPGTRRPPNGMCGAPRETGDPAELPADERAGCFGRAAAFGGRRARGGLGTPAGLQGARVDAPAPTRCPGPGDGCRLLRPPRAVVVSRGGYADRIASALPEIMWAPDEGDGLRGLAAPPVRRRRRGRESRRHRRPPRRGSGWQGAVRNSRARGV